MSFFDRIKETVSDKKLDFETLFSPKKNENSQHIRDERSWKNYTMEQT